MGANPEISERSPNIEAHLWELAEQGWEYLRQHQPAEGLRVAHDVLARMAGVSNIVLQGDMVLLCARAHHLLGSEAEAQSYLLRFLTGYEQARLQGQLPNLRLDETLRETEDIRQKNVELEQEINLRKTAEAELTQRAEQLAILRQMDEDMSNILDVDTVTLIALDAALRLSRAEAGVVAVTRGEDVTVAQFQGASTSLSIGMPIEPGRGIIGRVMVHQKPEWIPDVTADPDYLHDMPGIRAAMSLPLLARERLVGILQVETAHPERFTSEVFEFMKLLAGRIAVALENATLYGYISQQLKETRHLYQKVSRLERLKTDMIRIGAHDLKNPLSVMVLYLDLFRNDPELSERQRGYLQPMRESLQQMRDLVSDILSLERIETLAEQAVMNEINLVNSVQLAFDRQHNQARAKQQTITLDIETSALLILGDEAQLTEASANLIANAIKYTPDAGSITVRLRQEEGQAVFEVIDTGYGIPEAMQNGLFQPFYRAKTDETVEIVGTGLGLHLVKNIIERHGGSMIFHSVYRQGSTFGFRIPLHIPAAPNK